MNASPDSDIVPGAPAGGGDAVAWVHGVMATIMQRWWLLPVMMVVGLALASIYLHRADYVYAAELKVYAAPSSSGKSAPKGLGGLAALTGLSGGGDAISPFRFYLDGLYSPEVAKRMARDKTLMQTIFAGEWDKQNQRWRQPASLSGSVRSVVTGLFGLPQFGWQAPDADRLRGFIDYAVTVRQSVKTPIATIGFEYTDPVFAGQFLEKLHETVDSYLREQQAARTQGNIAYLSKKLRTVTLAEQRQALVTALTEEERQAMLAFGNAPYAADPFDVVNVSMTPMRPRPVPLLIGAALAGLLSGAVLALLLARRARRYG